MASSTVGHDGTFDLAASTGHFSDDLSKMLIPASHTGNALVSPLSLLTALSMLLAGSRGSTRKSLSSALRIPSDVPQTQIDSFYQTLLRAYKSNSKGDNKLLINNKLLVAKQFFDSAPVLPVYRETVRDKYSASIESVDFINNGPNVMKQVNNWVKESTDKLIPRLLDDPPSTDTVAMIVNTLYFEAEWANEFKDSYDRVFYVDGHKEKEAEFMGCIKAMRYLEIPLDRSDKPVQALSIPYRFNASMVILFPPPSVSVNELFKQRKVDTMVRQLIGANEKREINLLMPKFKFNAKMSMKDALTSMGAGDLFRAPDLSGINGASNLTISDVKHLTAIEVDEEGTKAAAATYIETMASMRLRYHPIEPLLIVLDRPFVCVIYDESHHVPVFVGKLADPSEPGVTSNLNLNSPLQC